jgi:signal transduction histidine kinase
MPGSRADRLNLPEVLRDTVGEYKSSDPVPRLEIRPGAEAVLHADRDRFTAVLGHIIQNAKDATRKDGTVTVRLDTRGEEARIEVEDSGTGMEPDFIRDRLFKPFDSTKGSQGMGIGAYQAREFARKIGGDLEIKSTPGEGTTVSLAVPVA